MTSRPPSVHAPPPFALPYARDALRQGGEARRRGERQRDFPRRAFDREHRRPRRGTRRRDQDVQAALRRKAALPARLSGAIPLRVERARADCRRPPARHRRFSDPLPLREGPRRPDLGGTHRWPVALGRRARPRRQGGQRRRDPNLPPRPHRNVRRGRAERLADQPPQPPRPHQSDPQPRRRPDHHRPGVGGGDPVPRARPVARRPTQRQLSGLRRHRLRPASRLDAGERGRGADAR